MVSGRVALLEWSIQKIGLVDWSGGYSKAFLGVPLN